MTRRLTGRSGLYGRTRQVPFRVDAFLALWRCRIRPSVRMDAFGGAEGRTPFGVANATGFGFEVVGCHERAHEIREDLNGDVWARMKFNMRS